MAQLKDSLITGDLRVTGTIYGLININASQVVSGTLPVARGGTGATTFTSGNVLVGAGTGAITTIAKTNANTANTLVQRDASGNFSAGTITATLSGNASTASKATAANLTTTANAVAYYTNTTGTFGTKASANGALYATSANGALTFGTLPVAQGGTGQTSAQNAANAFLQSLSTGGSTPVDGDTYIASYADGKNYAGGGTNTFHRRGISSLWTYIKGKADSVYAAKSHTHSYLPLSGGTLTGALTISNGADLILKAGSSATTDPGDLLFQNSSGTEIGRIYKQAGQNAFFIRYSSSSTPYKIYTAQEITSGSAAPSGGTSGDIYFQTGTTQDGWTTLWTGALQGSKTQAIAMDGYSKLRIWCCNYSVMYSFLVDLTTTGANTHNTSYPYYGGGTSVITGSGMEIHGCTVGVNAAKSTLYNEWMGYHKNSGANDRNSNASYYIYKVEGCK